MSVEFVEGGDRCGPVPSQSSRHVRAFANSRCDHVSGEDATCVPKRVLSRESCVARRNEADTMV